MADIRSLCVYCGSSDAGDPGHRAAAHALGRMAAGRGITIIFGGGHVGLMGALADGALGAGGRVIGIIPEHLMAREVAHAGVSEMIVTDSMHTRKRRMFELSDAFCILPGGMGTLDETFEIITWKQLGLHDKPIILVNLNGFWDPLLAMIEHQAEGGYIRPQHVGLLRVVARIESVFEALTVAPAAAVAPREDRL
ncbi:MAG: TIGR00730 family Rossman fold protein [Alphaproteobacteria bacterium]|nr:MAG: TIGR00730 family Rossman fold protein [Alphaproteobacteria bacterium]